MQLRVPLMLLGLLLGLVSGGCSGSRTADPAAGGRSGGATTPGIDSTSRLDLDNGRVSVFSPQGWRRAPRSYDYLVRYQSTPQLPYPSVIVVAADPPEAFSEVTAANHAAFVEAIAGTLDAPEGTGLLRKPSKANVGPHHAATWSIVGEAKLDGLSKKIERECTAVVIDGRLYTVEAWAPRGKLTDAGREAALAVAAALIVPSMEAIDSLVPPSEPTETEGEDASPAAEPVGEEITPAAEPELPAAEPA